MFDNGTNVEANKCRCEGVECQPSGTLNVSSCKYGAPAFVSLPHFYLADESYRQNITGMKLNKEDHQFSLILESVNNSYVFTFSKFYSKIIINLFILHLF